MTEADPGTTLRIYELLNMLRYAEATLLNALGAGRRADRSLSTSTVVERSRVELHDLRSAALDLAERAEQIGMVASKLAPTEPRIRWEVRFAEFARLDVSARLRVLADLGMTTRT